MVAPGSARRAGRVSWGTPYWLVKDGSRREVSLEGTPQFTVGDAYLVPLTRFPNLDAADAASGQVDEDSYTTNPGPYIWAPLASGTLVPINDGVLDIDTPTEDGTQSVDENWATQQFLDSRHPRLPTCCGTPCLTRRPLDLPRTIRLLAIEWPRDGE